MTKLTILRNSLYAMAVLCAVGSFARYASRQTEIARTVEEAGALLDQLMISHANARSMEQLATELIVAGVCLVLGFASHVGVRRLKARSGGGNLGFSDET